MEMAELTAAEKTSLTKSVNKAYELQERIAGLKKDMSAEQSVIRAQLKKARLDRWQTDDAQALLVEKFSRSLDAEAVQAIVDRPDFEVIFPRRQDLKAFDEIVGHHRYDGLDECVEESKSVTLMVGPKPRTAGA